MLKILYRKGIFRICNVWFLQNIGEISDTLKVDILNFRGFENSVQKKFSISKEQETLNTTLTNSADEIFSGYSSTVRNEIRRAERDGIVCHFYSADQMQIDPSLLKSFSEEFRLFTKLKGIKNSYNSKAIEAYLKENGLLLTQAIFGSTILAQHIYLYDKSHTRLLYSVSNFRNSDNKSLVGRANKYLHHYDIQVFKEMGILALDWGGVSSLTSPNGVDLFKMEFGGFPRIYYNISIGCSFFGKMLILIKKLMG